MPTLKIAALSWILLTVALAGGHAQTHSVEVENPPTDIQADPLKSGDLGNGYYRNPVLMAGDIADMGVIRVGKDYYGGYSKNC